MPNVIFTGPMDAFTSRRIIRFIETFRARTGQLPAGADFERDGFTREQVEAAVKTKVIEPFYVTLTNGTIVKGYKVRGPQ